MTMTRAACLLLTVLLTSMAVAVPAEEPPGPEALPTREFHLEHAHVRDANSIVRSLLNVRKCALDERRQVLILSDTPEVLERAAALLAQVDAAAPEWIVTLVAHQGPERSVLRTSTITDGHLNVRFGPTVATKPDTLRLAAKVTRAATGEIDLDWSADLAMANQWSESAEAVETLHDQATVTLVATPDPLRRKALGRLLGVPRPVDALVLEVSRAGAAGAGPAR